MSIIDNLEAVKAVDEKRRELQDEQANAVAAMQAEARADREAEAEWRIAYEAAVAAKLDPPARPVTGVNADVHAQIVATYTARFETLRRERLQAIAESAWTIEQTARDQAHTAMREAADAIAVVRQAADDINDAKQALIKHRRAVDQIAERQQDYDDAPFTVDHLLHMPEDADPLAGAADPKPRRKLGMSGWKAPEVNVPEPSEAEKQMMWRRTSAGRPYQPREPYQPLR